MKLQKRELWIDYAKFISIFLVVVFHTNPHLDGHLFNFLKLLRMPAFFMIAGLLFNINKWKSFTEFFKHRFERLIIPYFWFSLVFYILWLLIGRNMVGEAELAINPITPIKEFVLGSPSVVLAPYWFITCLFTIQILYYFLRKYIKSNALIIIVSIACYWGLIYFDLKDLPWCIDRAFLFLPFYAYANILKEHLQIILFKKKKSATLLACLSLIIIFLTNRLVLSQYINHILYILSGFCIIPIYVIFCKFLASKVKISYISNIIKYIGENNIITLALQNYIIGFVKIFGIACFSTNLLTTNHYTINIIIAITTILVSMSVAIAINKYAPFIIGKRRKDK
jgi:fucose 4-O-acetylase-like acetyltransferase